VDQNAHAARATAESTAWERGIKAGLQYPADLRSYAAVTAVERPPPRSGGFGDSNT
jgi:hypothetical protein